MKNLLIKVNKLLMLLFIVFLFNCEKEETNYKDFKTHTNIDLLKTYINNYKINNNSDSIFLANDNSNIEIYKTYKRYLNSNNESINETIIRVFNKRELDNFKTQSVDSSFWDIDISEFDNVFQENEASSMEDLLFVTKPIYTIDNAYALLYSYKKIGKKEMFFIPRIEVYQNKEKGWVKIEEIKHFSLK
ncbi:hypothetical protein [uncultured Lacinutrix sp.]|uniref:hypothetical protein n=1 Tax=uncultured Lacinutrix sp. TaxID=574032 RepID=UPI0026192FC7|nr:hypothetical protein [uncultured Lacinutrix sp.]